MTCKEVVMRYRIRITRVQVADRSVVAKDEEHAMEKVRAELDNHYGFLVHWQTTATEAKVTAVEPRGGMTPTLPDEGPLLMSLKQAAAHLGISYSRVYELVNGGEIDHVRIGRRTYLSRAALTKFIEANTRSGYQPEYVR
jgi:excisionase family DNA binding protein